MCCCDLRCVCFAVAGTLVLLQVFLVAKLLSSTPGNAGGTNLPIHTQTGIHATGSRSHAQGEHDAPGEPPPETTATTPDATTTLSAHTQHKGDKSTDAIGPKLFSLSDVKAADIAVVTMVGQTKVQGYNPSSLYHKVALLAIDNWRNYCNRHGYAFHHENDHLLEQDKQIYWSKISIIQHYLESFKVVLWTDVDTLVQHPEITLHSFLREDKTIVTVDECTQRRDTNPLPRSGFLVFVQSTSAGDFLQAWKESFARYKDAYNPEQTALEDMLRSPRWAPFNVMLSWSVLHSYDSCDGFQGAFSLHFPGHYKLLRYARKMHGMYMRRRLTCSSRSGTEDAPPYSCQLSAPRHLPDSVSQVTTQLLHESIWRPPFAPSLTISRSERSRTQKCLLNLKRLGYEAVGRGYDARFHAHVRWWEMDGLYHSIPTTIMHTGKKTALNEPQLADNMRTWVHMNPTFNSTFFDDEQVNALLRTFTPLTYELEDLLPVQRADIFRYLVVFLFGGFYADVDTRCMVPITQWPFAMDQTAVLGVEAQNIVTDRRHPGQIPVFLSQYVFGAAARHPALRLALQHIVRDIDSIAEARGKSSKERLDLVLRTTGPILFTNSFATYWCYADSAGQGDVLSPSTFWNGEGTASSRVFGIQAFGAGQAHSGSQSPKAPGTLVWHLFGGSQNMHGTTWANLKS